MPTPTDPIRFLIVEDSKAMRTFIKKCLSEIQDRIDSIVEAEDGQHALESLQENADVNFILADWDMPRMNGLEFVRKVRDELKLSEVPILMVTANTDFLHRLKAVDAGANGYVEKPFSAEELTTKVLSVWETGAP